MPAIVVALVLVARGGIVFVLGAGALGLVCMHELFALYARAHPARLSGFAALLGLMAAAQWGDTFDVLLVTVAALPIVFADTLAQRQGGAASVAITVLAIYWIGLAFAHAVLLRRLPHGEGILIDVLVGTFIGDTGAYFGGRMFGQRPLAPRISPNKTVEGLLVGMLCCVVGVWLASRYQDWLPERTPSRSAWASRSPDRSATCSSRSSSVTRASRTPARCSGHTAERSTGWTP